MAIALASLAALFFGTADFAGGRASRRNSIAAVLVWSQLVGLTLVVVFASVDPASTLTGPADLVAGAAAGLAGMGGLSFLYRGLARGYAAIVSPLAAVVGAVVPVAFGLASGEELSRLATLGIAVSLPAIALMSWEQKSTSARREPARVRHSWIHGAASGLFFGLFFVGISIPTPEAGVWPLAAARVTSVFAMTTLAIFTGRSRRVHAHHRTIILAGMLDMSANICFVLALRQGMLAIVTVIASAYPAQTVLLSRVVHGERVGAVRAAGVGLELPGIAMLSAG